MLDTITKYRAWPGKHNDHIFTWVQHFLTPFSFNFLHTFLLKLPKSLLFSTFGSSPECSSRSPVQFQYTLLHPIMWPTSRQQWPLVWHEKWREFLMICGDGFCAWALGLRISWGSLRGVWIGCSFLRSPSFVFPPANECAPMLFWLVDIKHPFDCLVAPVMGLTVAGAGYYLGSPHLCHCLSVLLCDCADELLSLNTFLFC